MSNSLCSIAVAIVLWKSVLLVFVSTDTKPLTMYVWQFEPTYISEINCRSAIAKRDLEADVATVIPAHIKVLHSNHACIKDDTGHPA